MSDAMNSATSPASPEPVVASVSAVEPAPHGATAATKKKRGFGLWAFFLALIVVLSDLVVIVIVVVAVFAAFGSLSSGALGAGADWGPVVKSILALGLFVIADFWVGFVLAGVAAVLGLIAIVSGRGRVIGFIGLILAAGAILVRVMILFNSSGLSNVVTNGSAGS
ncbi:MAG: hypothetical protein ABIR17_04255 [Pseudolysinimonas sp.]|uniref:hypothetical protein n=1 Tax=Pseudolysinimonas sp. TaxID=2680009 RepID=UPI0032661423